MNRGCEVALVFLLVATGCHQRPVPWSPVAASEQVLAVGDVVYRVEPDNSIVVHVAVTLEGVSAPGSARLLRVSLEAAQRSPHLKLARGRAWYALAHKLRAQPPLAFEAARRGFEEIGLVIEVGVNEHTDWRMHNAETALQTDPPRAVEMITFVLKRRLFRYTRRWHREVM